MSNYYNGSSPYPPSSSSSSSVPPSNNQSYGNSTGYYGAGGGSAQANYSAGQWQQPSTQMQPQSSTPQYSQFLPNPQQQQQNMQQQQQQPPQGSFTPASPSQQSQISTFGFDSTMAAAMAASALGANQPAVVVESIFRDSWAKMIPGLEAFLNTLRDYFAVDNKYVLQKIKTILFPFLKKDWHRNIKGYGGPDGSANFQLPIVDENAPDLYLPFMSLITYVLLCALVYGNAGKFNPEVIPDVTTKCFITQVLEVLFVRLGLYLLVTSQQQHHPNTQVIKVVAILDLLSYTGYKYLGLSVNMFLGLVANHFNLGARVYYLAFLWTASAASYFMYNTMKSSVMTTDSYSTGRGGTNQQIIVVAFAAGQFATMWFVSQTKNL